MQLKVRFNNMGNTKGFLLGIASSASFGLIPLFTLPLMAGGMVFDSILFYRFLIAALSIGIILICRKESFRIKRSEIPVLIILGILYACSALFLFWAYSFLSSGIATTIHFLYPVFVTLLMISIFHEANSKWTFLAILLAFTGVTLLSIGDSNGALNVVGISIATFSGFCYALYIIGVNKSSIREMKGLRLTFYVLMFGSILFLMLAQIKGTFQFITTKNELFNICMLAIIPTVVSNLTLVNAVKYIGSTLTSVLGALEPVTAVCVGVFIFGEPFTVNLASGIILIITAVSIIILSKQLNKSVLQLRSIIITHILRR